MPLFRKCSAKKRDTNLSHLSLARGTHVMVIDKNRLQEKTSTLTRGGGVQVKLRAGHFSASMRQFQQNDTGDNEQH